MKEAMSGENLKLKYDVGECCAFTGHRDLCEKVELALLEKCVKFLIGKGVNTFYCGMASGFDLVAGALILRLKGEFSQIKLIACVPCEGQQRYYSEEAKSEYLRILNECEEVKILSRNYYNGCMYARDRYMVDNCKYVIAFLRKSKGGTSYTVNYARTQNREIFII